MRLFIDSVQEHQDAAAECRQDAQKDQDAEGPHCLCGQPEPFEKGMELDCPVHPNEDDMTETKLGPNGLPLYKIRVIDGRHAVEVEGESVPNDFGMQLFLHRVLDEPALFRISEVLTGSSVVPYGFERKSDCILYTLEYLDEVEGQSDGLINKCRSLYGPIGECKVITAEQSKAMNLDPSVKKVRTITK